MSNIRKTSKKYPNKKLFKKALFKLFAVFVCTALNLNSLFAVGNTLAYFSDEAEINGLTFTAGTLDLTATSGQDNFVPLSIAGNMGPGSSVARDIYIGKTADSLPLKHRVSYQFVNGSSTFCDLLQLKIWYNHYSGPYNGSDYTNRDMRLRYNDPLTSLSNFTDPDFVIPHPDDQYDTDLNDGTRQWFFYEITYPADSQAMTDQKCDFKFVFDGWQTNMADPSSGGFVDTAELSSTLVDSIPEVEVVSEPATDEQPEEEQQDLVVEDPAIVKDPIVEPDQTEENIEDEEGDTVSQDEITQDEGSDAGDTASEDSSGDNEGITGGEEGDLAGQDEITQGDAGGENGGDGDTGNTDGNSGGEGEITGDGEGELTTA